MSQRREDNLIKDSLALMNDDRVVHIKDATKRNGEYTKPFSIGYKIFDDAMRGGVREGDLIGVAGRPKHGKSTICQNFSINIAANGNKCVWFSYEMGIDNFYAKFREMNCDIDNLRIYTPRQITTGSLEWIQEKILEADEKYGCKFVFIDHLDFVVPKKIKGLDQERLIKKQICLELKRMAVDLQITIFLIAHVRKVSGRNIELNDIAESSAVGQLADFVFGVDRKTKTEYVDGKKTEVFCDSGSLRLMANRIFRDCPIMNFTLDNDRIMEMGKIAEPKEDADKDLDIEVIMGDGQEKMDKLKDVNFFGYKN